MALSLVAPQLQAADEITGEALKKQNRELQIQLQIAKYNGQAKSAVSHAKATQIKTDRMKDLLARKVISMMEYRKQLKTSQMAALKVFQHQAELEGAKAELAIFQNETSGKQDPTLAKGAYGKMWKAMELMIATDVEVAKITVEHQNWYTEAIGKLVAVHATDPKMHEEALLDLAATREALAGKEAELKVIKTVNPYL